MYVYVYVFIFKFYMLVGKPPFIGNNEVELFSRIMLGLDRGIVSEVWPAGTRPWSCVTRDGKRLIHALLQPEGANRMSTADASNSRLVTDAVRAALERGSDAIQVSMCLGIGASQNLEEALSMGSGSRSRSGSRSGSRSRSRSGSGSRSGSEDEQEGW
jgi:hypothetical protein